MKLNCACEFGRDDKGRHDDVVEIVLGEARHQVAVRRRHDLELQSELLGDGRAEIDVEALVAVALAGELERWKGRVGTGEQRAGLDVCGAVMAADLVTAAMARSAGVCSPSTVVLVEPAAVVVVGETGATGERRSQDDEEYHYDDG